MKISDADKFIGQIHRREVVNRSMEFCKSYLVAKKIVKGLINDGAVNNQDIGLLKSHEEAITNAFPSIQRRGLFYNIWEII